MPIRKRQSIICSIRRCKGVGLYAEIGVYTLFDRQCRSVEGEADNARSHLQNYYIGRQISGGVG